MYKSSETFRKQLLTLIFRGGGVNVLWGTRITFSFIWLLVINVAQRSIMTLQILQKFFVMQQILINLPQLVKNAHIMYSEASSAASCSKNEE